jgi:ribosome modulation factor
MSQSEKSPLDAFREGLYARTQGRDLKSNPYEPCSIERFLWEGGWRTESADQGHSEPKSDCGAGEGRQAVDNWVVGPPGLSTHACLTRH